MDDDKALLLQVSADVSKLEKQMAKAVGIIHSSSTAMETRADAMSVNVGKALDKAFDSSRLAVLDAGASRLRVFGSALEPLGPLGLAAGAGVAALGIAVAQAVSAANWAEELETTAKRLGVTTTALQQFDYIAVASGLPIATFRDALAGLSEKIGQVQAGVARSQTKKIFEALGISPDQLRSLGTLQNILPAIADGLAKLPATEAIGLAKRLDISSILPAFQHGKQGLEDLQSAAIKAGYAIDSGLIKMGAEASVKLKLAADVIDNNLKSSFLTLAPAIADVTNALAKMLHYLSELRNNGWIGDLAHIEAGLARANVGDFKGASQSFWMGMNGAKLRAAGAHPDIPVTTGDILDRLNMSPGPGGAVSQLVPDKAKKAKKGPSDQTDALTKTADDALDAAIKGLAEAYKNLTADADKRAAFEIQANNAEAAAKQTALDADLKNLLKSKGIDGAVSDRLQRELELAKTKTEEARVAKQTLIEREAAKKSDEQWFADQKSISAEYQTIAKITAAMALTLVQRRDIEIRNLALTQKLNLEDAESKAKAEIAQDPGRADYWRAKIASIKDLNAAEMADLKIHLQGPGADYVHQLIVATSDASTNYQTIAVNGLQTLNSGLTQAIVNAKDFGAAFGNALRAIESDLINLALEKYLTLPLAQALGLAGGGGGGGGGIFSFLGSAASVASGGGFNPFAPVGYATGTDSAPGGLSIVGENGPELMNVPKGAQIIPNNVLGNLGAITPGMASHTTVMSFDLRGAVMTQDLLDQMNSLAKGAEQRATMNGAALGVSTARQVIPAEMARRSSLQIR